MSKRVSRNCLKCNGILTLRGSGKLGKYYRCKECLTNHRFDYAEEELCLCSDGERTLKRGMPNDAIPGARVYLDGQFVGIG